MITETPNPTPQQDPDQETRDALHHLLRLVAREVVRQLKLAQKGPEATDVKDERRHRRPQGPR